MANTTKSYEERVSNEVPALCRAKYGKDVYFEARYGATVDDLIGDVQVDALKKQKDFDPSRSNFTTWIHLLAITAVRRYIARRRRERNLFEKLTYKPAAAKHTIFPTSDTFSIDGVDTADMCDKLLECMRQQPPARQEMLQMYFVEGLTMEEIAAKRGCVKQNVSAQIKRSLSEINKQLDTGG